MKRVSSGRPRKLPGQLRSERIEVRADASEKRLLESAANEAGMKLSDWIRDRLHSEATSELAEAALSR